MAWNRQNEKKVEAEKRGGQQNAHLKGLVAGLIVVLGAGLAAWFLLSGEADTRPLQKKERGRIKEVTPAAAPKAADDSQKMSERELRIAKAMETYRDASGVLRYKNGNARAYDPNRPAKVRTLMQSNEKPLPFHYRSEKEIARFIVIPPGEPMFGDRVYDDDFVKDFMESLKEPIVVTAEDDAEDAELKRAMIDIKLEIMDRVRGGESVKDILEANRREVRRLAQFKRDLVLEVRNAATDETMTPEEVGDYLKAANVILEQNGLKPIEDNGIIRASIKRNMKKKGQ